jgi:hypothetical protein
MTIGSEKPSGQPSPTSTAVRFSIPTIRTDHADSDRSARINSRQCCVFNLELQERFLQGLFSAEGTSRWDARATSVRIPIKERRPCRSIDQRTGIQASRLQSLTENSSAPLRSTWEFQGLFSRMEEPSLEQSRVGIAWNRGS